MVWLPTLRAVVVNVATPPLNVPLPIGVPPSRKVTDPVGPVIGTVGAAPGGTTATVAVKVTDWPRLEGFSDEVTAVVVSALLTTCGLPVNAPELPTKFASPP